MNTPDSDRQLSALFQVKREEAPSQEFWHSFDRQLQIRYSAYLEQNEKVSWIEALFGLFERYRSGFSALCYTACCAVLFLALGPTPFSSVKNLSSEASSSTLAYAPSDVLSLSTGNVKDSTLSFSAYRNTRAQYVSNDLYRKHWNPGLNPAPKELVF